MANRARRRGGEVDFAEKVGLISGVQSQPTVNPPSAQFIGQAAPMVPGDMFGRLGKGPRNGRTQIEALATAQGAGNSVVRSDPRGEPAAFPWGGAGHGIANTSPYPASTVQTPHSLDSAGAHARTAAFQHGRLIARDRHIIANQGYVTSSDAEQRTGANPNPEADGPARPTWKMFNRSISYQSGTDNTRNLDNNDYHASVLAGTRKFPLATQGQEWSIRYGGTPFLTNHRPYGHRGGFDDNAPLPTERAQPGGPYKSRTLLQTGSPEDGPQKIYGGLPWGLHSPTMPARGQVQSLVRSRLGQVKPVHANRPQNSKVAGQSWSQSMVSLSGRQAVKLTTTPPMRLPGLHARYYGS